VEKVEKVKKVEEKVEGEVEGWEEEDGRRAKGQLEGGQRGTYMSLKIKLKAERAKGRRTICD
jgi:hypothetical protein